MYDKSPDRSKLALVMVGLPARGKSYTARKVSRYLSWLGYTTKVFNVGEYRRQKLGARMQHEFFDPKNEEGAWARRLLAMDALDDMCHWLGNAGEVGIYDATNSTRTRRLELKERCEREGVSVLFVEIHCSDLSLVEANVKATKLTSPDYRDVPPQEAVRDFRARIAHYEAAYESVREDEGSFVRITDAGRRLEIHRVDGYLTSRVLFYIMTLHLTHRPILLTRHGESVYNRGGLIGGDTDLSPAGQAYAHALADFLDKHFPDSKSTVIWTSSMRRAVQTANPLGRTSMAWRALDEIDAGICDGMSYEQIRVQMPDEYEARKQDKFRYRYPRGESYQDVIQRLQPVIIELERTRKPVAVIAHQAVLRALYAYFTGTEVARCPYLSVPLHTVLKLTPHAYGCHEERFPLSPNIPPAHTQLPSTPPGDLP